MRVCLPSFDRTAESEDREREGMKCIKGSRPGLKGLLGLPVIHFLNTITAPMTLKSLLKVSAF